MKKRYLYKLRPGKTTQAHLRQEYALTRWVWNECVNQFRTGGKPTAAKLDKLLTEARRNASWLRAGSSVVQQQEIRNYAKALQQSFDVPGRRRPRFKTAKKHPYVSLNYTRNGFRIKDGRLHLAGGVSIPVVWSRDLPSEPSSVRVYEDASGWWWASFVVEVADDTLPQAPDTAIGIDWGIKMTATTTDPGCDLQYQETAKKHARNLKKYQRRMALHKQQRDAAEKQAYARAKKRAAREHRRIKNQRQERARKWAQHVARSHRNVAVEDFKPKFLAKSTMSRKMHVAAISALRRELEQAVARRGGNIVSVPAAYTTMTCSSCGARAKHRIPLQQRVFACETCGFADDRDHNAALNILYWAGFNPTLDNGCQSDTTSVVPAS